MAIDSDADTGIASKNGAQFWEQTNFMQMNITSVRFDRNGRRLNISRRALAKPAASGPRQWAGAFYTKLPLIAGIIRNVAGLQFAQRFPDEIASA